MADLKRKQPEALVQQSFNATQIVANLAQVDGWKLSGDGKDVAIEKSFSFADYFETIAFVNAVAWIAHRADHHPDLSVHYNRCVVRYSTHSVGGISALDFENAKQIDALLA